jgi:hypothetical protein
MRRLIAILTLAMSGASAQVNLLPSTAWDSRNAGRLAFHDAARDVRRQVQDVAQAAVPFQVRVGVGAWTFDVTGAYVAGAVHMASATSSSSDDGESDDVSLLAGPTDMKVRMSGPLFGERLHLIAGVNLPTGTTRLNADQLTVLQTVSAPGSRCQCPRMAWERAERLVSSTWWRLPAGRWRSAGRWRNGPSTRPSRWPSRQGAAAICVSLRESLRISPSAPTASWARRD